MRWAALSVDCADTQDVRRQEHWIADTDEITKRMYFKNQETQVRHHDPNMLSDS